MSRQRQAEADRGSELDSGGRSKRQTNGWSQTETEAKQEASVSAAEDPSLVHERGEGGMTALHFAADRGFADIARMLIAKGALVNLQDECGETALHVAIAAEQQELISLLLEAGTDTSLKNNEGKSCDELLKEAENRGDKETVSLSLSPVCLSYRQTDKATKEDRQFG
ncbi:acyl-CoA-binding protein, putative [Eimeria brunetti]|uniref:Acyl-CoA-binding protein, putative n=1 Tax=Eimeria brunetti TaxID=51314 RepID=U6LCU1_9EIME|nr:acyl-CoA-binding protein, putative [Eimeria brunetti]